MYPEIIIRYSYYLQIKFLRCSCNFKKLEEFVIKFEKYFRSYRLLILKNIERYTGIKWKQKRILVWFFESYHPSISIPLLVNVYNYSRDFCLFTLVHELVHNNLYFSELRIFDKIKLKDLEAIVELVTKNVCKYIFSKEKLNELCKTSEFSGEYRKVWEKEKELEKIWNLEEKPLIKWLQT